MPTLKEYPDALQSFRFHGLDFDLPSTGETDIQTDCPFCDKPNHFYLRVTPNKNAKPKPKFPGEWNCQRCGLSGNQYTFLRLLHEHSQAHTTPADYKALSEAKGIPSRALSSQGIAVNVLNGNWIFPIRNAQGALSNLTAYAPANLSKPCNTPKMALHLMGGCDIGDRPIVWVAEGVWDLIAWHSVLTTYRRATFKGKSVLLPTTSLASSLAKTEAVVAVPGATTFKAEWVEQLAGKDVRLCLDNDKAGGEGIAKILRILSQTETPPKTVSYLDWAKEGYEIPEHYDLKDLIAEDHPSGAYSFAQGSLVAADLSKDESNPNGQPDDGQEEIEPIPCTRFRDLKEAFAKPLYFPQIMEDTLVAMLAVCASTTVPGDQLWLRVIGPPGSGKSTLAEALSAAKEYIYPVSVFTGIHSGFKDPKGGKRQDNSLMPKLLNKTTIVKDADTLLSSSTRDATLAQLRDIYDGTSRAQYLNKISNNYDSIRSTWIVCGTDELRSTNRSFLGDRFLDCEVFEEGDTQSFLDMAMTNAIKQTEQKAGTKDNPAKSQFHELQAITYGYLQHLKDTVEAKDPPPIPENFQHRIGDLARFLAAMRTRVNRKKLGSLSYRPRIEIPTRIVSQLSRLAIYSAVVLGRKRVDATSFRIVRKVVMDTSKGFPLEIVSLIRKQPNGLSIKQLMGPLGMSETETRRQLDDLKILEIVTPNLRPNRSGVAGRHDHAFILTDRIQALTKRVRL